MDIPQKIEAILFATAEPLSFKELASLLQISVDEVKKASDALSVLLHDRGIVLVETGDKIELRTHKDATEVVEKALEEPFTKSIGPAGGEVLSIILYKGSTTRGEIEQIRGVNSGSVLRLLSMRGLVRRRSGEGEGRLYEPTEELLAHLGVSRVEDLSEYQETRERLSALQEVRNEEYAEHQ